MPDSILGMSQPTNRLPPQPVFTIRPDLTLEEFEYARALVLMAWKHGFTRSTGERYVLLTLEAKLNKLAEDITQAAQANGNPEVKEKEETP